MSVVAVKITKDTIFLGADSQTSISSQKWQYNKNNQEEEHSKIFVDKEKDLYIGGVGHANETFLFKNFCKTNSPKANSADALSDFYFKFCEELLEKDKKQNLGIRPCNSYIIAYKRKAYHLSSYQSFVSEITDFDAIGSGSTVAKALLWSGNSLKKSLEGSCAIDLYCGLPLQIFELKR